MSEWSLPKLLTGLHDDIEQQLFTARQSFAHPGTKGDASEAVWIDLFNKYLPERYRAEKCHVVDSRGAFSQQIDVAIFDRQYSPFVATVEGQHIIPAESVYAVFEAKQSANAAHISYAQEKAATVRALHRTSLPIPSAGGELPAKVPQPILAGLLTFESDWNPPLGEPLLSALAAGIGDKRLDIGCVAAHGLFWCDKDGRHIATPSGTAATAFLFEVIAQLQAVATVPMIDVRAYAVWLDRAG
jgi:hypothetical protein